MCSACADGMLPGLDSSIFSGLSIKGGACSTHNIKSARPLPYSARSLTRFTALRMPLQEHSGKCYYDQSTRIFI